MIWVLLGPAWASSPRDLVAPLGTDRLAEIEELRFTFVVERDGVEASRRAWTWRPAEEKVTRRTADGELTFHAGAPTTEEERKADAQFVNDGFWLVPHLHVRWAETGLTLVDHGSAPVPVGEGTARRVEAIYAGDGGGYTPGDAYDLFLDADGRMVGWVFRKGAAPEPSLATTFSGWVHLGPLQLATDHVTADGSLRVRFTDLEVTLAPGVATVASPGGAPILGIGPSGCRLRGAEVPLATHGAGMAPIAGPEVVFDAEFEVRMGARREPLRVSSVGLVADPPELATALGLGRCDVRALAPEVVTSLLTSATREERALWITLGLAAWVPVEAPKLVVQKVVDAARACVDAADCGTLVDALTRR